MHSARFTSADELLECVGTLGLAPAPSVTVLDMTDITPRAAAALSGRLHGRRAGILIGWSSSPLEPTSTPLLAELTTTLCPTEVGVHGVKRGGDALEALLENIQVAPLAAAHLDLLLGTADGLQAPAALVAESLVYGNLLAAGEHAEWLLRQPRRSPPPRASEPVILARSEARLHLTLNRPERRNAFGSQVRDAFCEALDLALLDPSIEKVHVKGNGPCFSAGGDLDEFGTLLDPASATLQRISDSPAGRMNDLSDKLVVELHGACVGAGIELPAFAARIEAHEGTWFRLPEIAMGLIPGAGGTVSVTRRVGRWRAAYMMLSGEQIALEEALLWRLVDDVVA